MERSNTPARQTNTISLLAGGLSLIVLLAHAYLGSFSRWIADDYCSGAEAARFGLLRATWFWLRTWNGRYSADFLDAFFGILGPGVTPFVTTIVLALWLIVLAIAVRVVFQDSANENRSWALPLTSAGVILCATLALSPNVAQSLYWGQGMRSVLPPLVTITLYVALLAWSSSRTWSRWAVGALALAGFVIAFAAGGFSETSTAVQLAAFSLASLVWLMGSRRPRSLSRSMVLGAGLLATVLAFAVMVLSPGNAGRAAQLPPHPALSELIAISLAGFLMFLRDLLGSPLHWIALTSTFAAGVWLGASTHVRVRGWRVAAGIAVTGTLLIICAFPPAAYATSEPPSGRTLIIPIYTLVIMLVAFGASLSSRPPGQVNIASISGVALVALLAVGTALTLVRIAEVQPEYAAYAEAWSGFHAQMMAYQQSGIANAQVDTAALKQYNWTELNTIGDNPKFWLNQCVSQYYRVNVISNTP